MNQTATKTDLIPSKTNIDRFKEYFYEAFSGMENAIIYLRRHVISLPFETEYSERMKIYLADMEREHEDMSLTRQDIENEL